MTELLMMIIAGLAGMLLGAFFFGGLWWTVRKGLVSRQPALWFLGSLVVRVSLTMGGFYLVGAGQPQRLLPCLAGFIIARMLVSYLTRPALPEVTHAA